MKYNNAQLSTLGNHIYETNIPGIGIRLSSGNYFDNPPVTFSYNATTSYVDWFGGKVELIVTGPVSPGVLNPGTLGAVSLQGSDGIYRDGLTVVVASGTINVLACSVSSTQLTFPIGDIPVSLFGSTIGTTPGNAQVTQNIGLVCNTGANIKVVLSGIQNPDNSTPSVIALTGQGSPGVASGVGVQFLYNGAPLALNTSLLLKQSAGGQELLPLTARYYQTKTTVMPGIANASATLSVTYQ